MAFVILGPIHTDLGQEIINNQTDRENHFNILYDDSRESGTVSPVICILYFAFLITAILISVLSNKAQRRNEDRPSQRQEIIFRRSDRPPSYKKIFFSDKPPQYCDVIV